MTSYARIVNNEVAEIFEPFTDSNGRDVPIEERFHVDIVAQCVAIPAGITVKQGWTYDGTSFAKPVPPAPLPITQVSKRQAALALFDAGKLQAVQAAIAQDPRATVEWEASATIERQSPLVLQLGEALGLDLDALFAHAATL